MLHIGRRLRFWLIVSGSLLFLIIATAVFYSSIGTIGDVGTNGAPLSAADLSSIPPSVIADARDTALKLAGDALDKYDSLYNQLLGLYMRAKDKDVVVVFNSGGWGGTVVENAEGWFSIVEGIRAKLSSFGYETLFLNYQRTEKNIRAYIDELVELLRLYPTKVTYLSERINFLTSHVPDLSVIIAGESNGTVISDGVMKRLKDNHRIYSIHTGPPFWHKPTVRERTLVLESNGTAPDTFSDGDVPAILWASFKAAIGFLPGENERGTIFNSLIAPGHDYGWQYPAVEEKISGFLEKNFSNNGRKP